MSTRLSLVLVFQTQEISWQAIKGPAADGDVRDQYRGDIAGVDSVYP
jgi:hypothetical protein